jgi:hypothetical protein
MLKAMEREPHVVKLAIDVPDVLGAATAVR